MTPAQTDRIERIARAWQFLGGDELGLPVTDATLDELEAALGRPLPPEVRAVYRTIGHEAAYGMCSNLDMAPPLGGQGAVATCANELRGWDWKIPEEVVVFGSDGGGLVYGLWLPAEGSLRHPILLLGPGDDAGPNMGIITQDLPALVAAQMVLCGGIWTAERDGAVQEILGVPDDLRGDPEDRLPPAELNGDAESVMTDPVLRWSSPDMPEVTYDPFRGMTVADVHRIANRP